MHRHVFCPECTLKYPDSTKLSIKGSTQVVLLVQCACSSALEMFLFAVADLLSGITSQSARVHTTGCRLPPKTPLGEGPGKFGE